MSQIEAAKVKVGASATPSQNFTLRSPNDGTFRVSRGNPGAETVDVISVAADGAISGNFPPTGLGIGQTWQNLTGSRAAGVSYTNTTGKPILVVPHMSHGGGTFFASTFTINGVLVGSMNAGNATYSQTLPFSFIVPVGGVYQLTITGGGGSVSSWSELR